MDGADGGPLAPQQTSGLESIHDAVARQDKRGVASCLQRHPECVMQQDEDQRTPLLLAAAAGDSSTCTLLIRRMAAYNADG
eukprot:2604719-Prymnesium_polylepis.1